VVLEVSGLLNVSQAFSPELLELPLLLLLELLVKLLCLLVDKLMLRAHLSMVRWEWRYWL
jgi:hypothetical protein